METGPFMLDPAAQAAIVETLCEKLTTHYVFPEVAGQIAANLQRCLAEGAYEQITEGEAFASLLTEHLRQVNGDRHLGVHWHPEPLPERRGPPSAEQLELWRLGAGLDNYGLYKVERLPGNVGYLNIEHFDNPAWGGDTLAAAMTFLSHTSALILDLRQNGGGYPGMVALLCSYLLGDEPVHLLTFHRREGSDEEIRQSWTLPYVPGRRYGDGPVYVLTSKATFSGGEECAYDLKTRKRATLIGEVTGGGANPGGGHRLHPNFEAFIPDGRPVSPVTGENWEGTGVEPDIPAEAAQAFQIAYRLALQAVIEQFSEKPADPYRWFKEEAQKALKGLETQ